MKTSLPDKQMYFAGPAITSLDPTMQMHYRAMVQFPRDLGTIFLRLVDPASIGYLPYGSIAEFMEDVDLCFENSKRFCGAFPEFKWMCKITDELQKAFHKKRTGDSKKNTIESTSHFRQPPQPVSKPTQQRAKQKQHHHHHHQQPQQQQWVPAVLPRRQHVAMGGYGGTCEERFVKLLLGESVVRNNLQKAVSPQVCRTDVYVGL